MKFKSKKIRLSLNLLLAVVFKALLREQETKHAIEDAEIKGLELQAQKEMLQHVSVPSSCYLGRHVNPPEQKVVSHFLGSRVSHIRPSRFIESPPPLRGVVWYNLSRILQSRFTEPSHTRRDPIQEPPKPVPEIAGTF